MDPFRRLDIKFRFLARVLRSWSATKVGCVHFQLAIAREVVLRLDEAQESRDLSSRELELRKAFKLRTLGLASLARTVARQRSGCIFWLKGMRTQNFSICKPAIGNATAGFSHCLFRAPRFRTRAFWHRKLLTTTTPSSAQTSRGRNALISP